MDNPDPRMRNGWAEYQRLVLAELERHNSLIDKFNSKLNEIGTTMALQRQRDDQIEALIKTAMIRLDNHEKQLNGFSQNTAVDDAIRKYRKWIVGAIIMFASSILIPLIKIIFFPGS